MTEIINRVAELRKDIEAGKLIDVIEISVELIRIESLLQILQDQDGIQVGCSVDAKSYATAYTKAGKKSTIGCVDEMIAAIGLILA